MKQRPKLAKQRIIAACVALVTACAAFSPSLRTDACARCRPRRERPWQPRHGRYTATEKDIALDVALKLGAYIEDNLPEVNVIYTRKDDSFPTLRDRVKMANEAQADLFLSIHCDAFETKGARGSSTYVMGMHKSDESLRVAMRENAAMFNGQDGT